MLKLSNAQLRHLCDFVLASREPSQPIDSGMDRTLGYIMSKVDVRRPEKIADESIQELVRCTFGLLKNDYLFENGLIAHSVHRKTIIETQARLKASCPEISD